MEKKQSIFEYIMETTQKDDCNPKFLLQLIHSIAKTALANEKMEEAFGVKDGTKVYSVAPIDRFSHFVIQELITGTVRLMNDNGDLMVKVDKHFAELNEWNNCITYPNDGIKDGFVTAFKQEFGVIQG